MSHVHLILVEFNRNRVRSALGIGTIACAFLLFGLLGSVRSTFLEAGASAHGAARLVTMSRHVLASPLPVSLDARISDVKGIVAHGHATWFGGYYQQPSNPIAAYAVSRSYFAVYPELEVDPWARKAFESTQNGILVGESVSRSNGWRPGQTVPIASTTFVRADGHPHWEFVIVGILRAKDTDNATFYSNTVLMHWDYLANTSPYVEGRVGWYVSTVKDVSLSDQVARQIDMISANSADETRSMSEQAAFAAQVRQLGDIDLITRSIMGAVLFSLLLTTASTMGQSLRERRSEIATLRAIGFQRGRLAALLIGESVTLYLAGCVLGLTMAAACIGIAATVFGELAALRPTPPADWLAAACMALLLGVLVGAGAACRHLRRDIAGTLAGR